MKCFSCGKEMSPDTPEACSECGATMTSQIRELEAFCREAVKKAKDSGQSRNALLALVKDKDLQNP